MDPAATIARTRERAGTLSFESPTRGAVCLTRLAYALPASESVAGSPADIAIAIIRRTIRHSHHAHAGLDQLGAGAWVTFSRHVNEGDQRWDFEVDVAIDGNDRAVISDVRVVRPGDDGADPDDPDAEPVEPRAPLRAADLLPHGMLACPCCGHASLTARGVYQICPICFWEDDGQDNADADAERGGPNRVSLARGRANYIATGAHVEADRPHVRAPTREEVRLRRFAADGRESCAIVRAR